MWSGSHQSMLERVVMPGHWIWRSSWRAAQIDVRLGEARELCYRHRSTLHFLVLCYSQIRDRRPGAVPFTDRRHGAVLFQGSPKNSRASTVSLRRRADARLVRQLESCACLLLAASPARGLASSPSWTARGLPTSSAPPAAASCSNTHRCESSLAHCPVEALGRKQGN
jgi:hypothetical protein